MALETVTDIDDLVITNPTAGDPKDEGDDHIRNTKKALKNGFPGFTGAVLATGVEGGAVNAYTSTPANALPAYTAKTIYELTPTITNTGAVTYNFSGLGARDVKTVAGADLVAGDLVANTSYLAFDTGTQIWLASPTKRYMDAIVVSNTLPGVDTPANAGLFYKTDGANGSWAPIDGRGDPAFDKGNSGTASQEIDYADGEGQTITATGSHTLTTAGWPAGRLAAVLLRYVNGGAFTITTTGITWFKSDGTTTTDFAESGIALQISGPSVVLLFSYGDGTVYGRG